MDVRYITVKSNKLNTIPIVDGQIIAISDKDAWFYDMEGTRRVVSGQKMVESLPTDTSGIYPDTLFFVTSGPNKGICWWTGTEFKTVANANTDENVKSVPTELDKFYLIGDAKATENVSTTKKHASVYVDGSTGKLHAEGFTGGSADNAELAKKAELAEKATGDSKGQDITKTYIAKITNKGTEVTITYGDGSTKQITTQDTDTHCVTNLVVTNSATSKENLVAKNGELRLNVFDDDQLRSSHKISGSGSASVTSDSEGNIDIKANDTWKANTAEQEGYVAKGIPNKVWSTDEAGNPDWRTPESTYEHPDSGVVPGTYKSVTVNAQGHVTTGSNPNTLQGYGIQDAVQYQILNAKTDLNSIIEPGFYLGLSGNNITNKPSDVDSFGILVLPTDSDDVVQKLFGSGSEGNQYTRKQVTGVFGSWSVDELTDTVYTHPTTPGYIHLPGGGQSGQILVWKADGTAQWEDPVSVAVSVMVGSTETEDGKSGVVPAPDAGPATAYLRNDGVWEVPPDTKYDDVVGTDGSESGKSGLVPAPDASDSGKFLSASGEWDNVPIPDMRPKWEEFPE